jgi:hypothetical protein
VKAPGSDTTRVFFPARRAFMDTFVGGKLWCSSTSGNASPGLIICSETASETLSAAPQKACHGEGTVGTLTFPEGGVWVLEPLPPSVPVVLRVHFAGPSWP